MKADAHTVGLWWMRHEAGMEQCDSAAVGWRHPQAQGSEVLRAMTNDADIFLLQRHTPKIFRSFSGFPVCEKYEKLKINFARF